MYDLCALSKIIFESMYITSLKFYQKVFLKLVYIHIHTPYYEHPSMKHLKNKNSIKINISFVWLL